MFDHGGRGGSAPPGGPGTAWRPHTAEGPGARSVVVAGARTPLGGPGGSLRPPPVPELGAVAIRAALERARVSGGEVDRVLMGHAGARGGDDGAVHLAAVRAGLPPGVPSHAVRRVPPGGLHAIVAADRLIRGGGCDIVVAGGMECPGPARPRPAAGSPHAWVPAFSQAVPPAVGGAAAVVVMRRSLAQQRQLEWLAEIIGHGVVTGPEDARYWLPSLAIHRALAPFRLRGPTLNGPAADASLAAVVARSMTSLSGARIVLHLLHTLHRKGGGLGAAGVCAAGGRGEALLLRTAACRP